MVPEFYNTETFEDLVNLGKITEQGVGQCSGSGASKLPGTNDMWSPDNRDS